MIHRTGDHALLADGRTAALLAPDGDVAWLCWPRIDSAPVLLGLLDRRRGGCFRVRPARGGRVVERGYRDRSLVLRTVWETGQGRLVVDDALATEGPPRLLRGLRAEGGEIEVEVGFLPAPGAATVTPRWDRGPGRTVAVAGADRLAVDARADWELGREGADARLRVRPGEPRAVVLSGGAPELTEAAALALLEETVAGWRRLAARMRPAGVESRAVGRALGAGPAAATVELSGLVLCGLRQRGDDRGIVAAPTTSLPQWPGSSRTWDYRYAWLRDTALAGLALLRLQLVEEAAALGSFCGEACRGGRVPVMLRVDGTAPPAETVLPHLEGHGGARPVRVGNAAAEQAQLDVAGEVLDLAHALARAGALPEPLRAAVPELAGMAAREWDRPDHGIWEIRGAPRPYTLSRVMAWTGLRRAAALARRGIVAGDGDGWERAAAAVRRAVLEGLPGGAPLPLHPGGGLDGALSLAVLVGFLPSRGTRARATLEAISRELGESGLVDRHSPLDDGIPDPCAPFLFATLWLAAALDRAHGGGEAHAAAALREHGVGGLLGEVALPGRGPLGNYPQTQSHASLILAATAAPQEDPAWSRTASR